jgi:hypothetical protein
MQQEAWDYMDPIQPTADDHPAHSRELCEWAKIVFSVFSVPRDPKFVTVIIKSNFYSTFGVKTCCVFFKVIFRIPVVF